MIWTDSIENYARETGFPSSLFVAEGGRVVGTWIMGNNYRVKSTYYGGYPTGYLRRIRALFPDKQRVLHLFSGMVDTDAFSRRHGRHQAHLCRRRPVARDGAARALRPGARDPTLWRTL